jgi:uncharacterized protein YndB with AHSA1/START domain
MSSATPDPLPADPACELFTSRTLPFARETVFRAWIDANQLARWWGPEGFTNTFEIFEPRAGGHWRHVMHGPDGRNYANFSVFRVVTPERIELAHVSEPRFDLIATFAEGHAGTCVTFLQRFASAAVRDAVAPICIPANEQNLDRLTRVVGEAVVSRA